MDDFYRSVDMDGWNLTITRSDTIDIALECDYPEQLLFHLNADQLEELIRALIDASEIYQ